jgi:hypothetical protein
LELDPLHKARKISIWNAKRIKDRYRTFCSEHLAEKGFYSVEIWPQAVLKPDCKQVGPRGTIWLAHVLPGGAMLNKHPLPEASRCPFFRPHILRISMCIRFLELKDQQILIVRNRPPPMLLELKKANVHQAGVNSVITIWHLQLVRSLRMVKVSALLAGRNALSLHRLKHCRDLPEWVISPSYHWIQARHIRAALERGPGSAQHLHNWNGTKP